MPQKLGDLDILWDPKHSMAKTEIERYGCWSRVKGDTAMINNVVTNWSDAVNKQKPILIRANKRMMADMSPAEWFALPRVPQTIAVLFQKGECANARGISSVDTHTTYAGKYVLSGFDAAVHRVPGGDSGSNAFLDIANKRRRRQLMQTKSGGLGLCFDWASFQDYHIEIAMDIHYEELLGVLNTLRGVNALAIASKINVVKWMRAALKNRWIMVAGVAHKVKVSLLSGDPDTNGINTRFNIVESARAINDGKRAAGLLMNEVPELENQESFMCRHSYSKGDDLWCWLLNMAVLLFSFLSLMVTGRPANKLKQVLGYVEPRWPEYNCDTDYLRCRETEFESRGQFGRALGPLINAPWESKPREDLGVKLRTMAEGLLKLGRRGGACWRLGWIWNSHIDWWSRGLHDTRLRTDVAHVMECCNGLGCAMHPDEASWDRWSRSVPQLRARAEVVSAQAKGIGTGDCVFSIPALARRPHFAAMVAGSLHRSLYAGVPSVREKDKALREYAEAIKSWNEDVVITKQETHLTYYLPNVVSDAERFSFRTCSSEPKRFTLCLKVSGTGHQYYEPDANGFRRLVAGDDLLRRGCKRRGLNMWFHGLMRTRAGRIDGAGIANGLSVLLDEAVHAGITVNQVICFSVAPHMMDLVAKWVLRNRADVAWVYVVVPQPREAYRSVDTEDGVRMEPKALVRDGRVTWEGIDRALSYKLGYERWRDREPLLSERVTRVPSLSDVDRVGAPVLKLPVWLSTGDGGQFVEQWSDRSVWWLWRALEDPSVVKELNESGQRFTQQLPTQSYDALVSMADEAGLSILDATALLLKEAGAQKALETLSRARMCLGDEKVLAIEQGISNLPQCVLRWIGTKLASCLRRCVFHAMWELMDKLRPYTEQEMRELFVCVILSCAMRVVMDTRLNTVELD
eukprot:GHVN01065856.1.p1 GENE.GHVN01065856.1~~GHVN01065856.1.p1  ORF type:complete len:1051 (+),score=46.82 GHVN01065856.1:409-3153(+)